MHALFDGVVIFFIFELLPWFLDIFLIVNFSTVVARVKLFFPFETHLNIRITALSPVLRFLQI